MGGANNALKKKLTRHRSISFELERSAIRRGSVELTMERSRMLNSENFYNAALIRYNGWTKLFAAVRDGDQEKALKLMSCLEPTEMLNGYPGPDILADMRKFIEKKLYAEAIPLVEKVVARFSVRHGVGGKSQDDTAATQFDVLFVQNKNDIGDIHCDVEFELEKVDKAGDPYKYACVSVTSFEDAVIAVLFNPEIQAVVVTPDFTAQTEVPLFRHRFTIKGHPKKLQGMEEYLDKPLEKVLKGACIYDTDFNDRQIRPELDMYYGGGSTYTADMQASAQHVKRVFSALDDHTELHLTILEGIRSRANTPFFDALVAYSRRPVGVFHALAISRGNSLLKSRWIQDFLEFYGRNLFKAESSATCGGLDSLLDPTGTIKVAQEKAAKAFGAQHTYFVTNGTSTANKIVCQALMAPGDIVLIDRDCHKSHHYGMVLAGVNACYLDAFPLHDYSMYGCVSLRRIKQALLDYKKAGKLDRVKMVILTNCTFDGHVYNTKRYMEELLAIKPDLVFLWDEAWFAYAYFNPIMRTRTGMGTAGTLHEQFCSDEYRAQYNEWKAKFGSLDGKDDEAILNERLWPDPDTTKVRVYVTQSTHKSLTAIRQGSMIHIWDELYRKQVEQNFHEAFFTHTSTSPNYQILASLDVGRAQMQLEGFRFTDDMISAAMSVRKAAIDDPVISRYMHFLDVDEMIPAEYRTSSEVRKEHKFYGDGLFQRMETWWLSDDEVVLDPTRLTLFVGDAGIEGDQFKVKWLMDKYDIQVNKTSRNSVLFQTNIGTTLSSIGYLKQALHRCALEIAEDRRNASSNRLMLIEKKIRDLTEDAPDLPDFSAFHPAFKEAGPAQTPDGDMRTAFFLAYDEENFHYVNKKDALKRVSDGELLVATTFIIPYPPGFPILVPGQIVTKEIIEFLNKLDVKEIHGYDSRFGLRVFKQSVLDRLVAEKSGSVPAAALDIKSNTADGGDMDVDEPEQERVSRKRRSSAGPSEASNKITRRSTRQTLKDEA